MKRKKKKKLTGIAQIRAMMKELGYDSEKIDSLVTQVKNLKGWTPITLIELMEMSDKDLKKLKSYCWHDGNYRCDTIGISNLKVIKVAEGRYNVEWSDNDGDPNLYSVLLDEEIHNIGDGEWNYGLYKKK